MRGWKRRILGQWAGSAANPVLAAEASNGGFPLSEARTDQEVKVINLAGGGGFRARLAELGIGPGSLLKVIANIGGPVIVDVKGAKMCLGRGMARRIVVTAPAGGGESKG